METRKPLGRRSFLQGSLAAAVAAWLTHPLGRLSAAATSGVAPARHLIVLWLHGGPSHIDSFDPKPGTRAGGVFGTIATSRKGLMFTNHVPRLAAAADRLSLIRSMTSREGSHGRAQSLMHTGYLPTPTVDHPTLAALVSQGLERVEDLPASVVLGEVVWGPGFLGPAHAPFVVQETGRGATQLEAPRGLGAQRIQGRLGLLDSFEGHFARTNSPQMSASFHDAMARAARMVTSPRRAAFDLSTESPALRKSYGSTSFGSRCLVARRLVQAGVRVVEVPLVGWDTHEDNFTRSARLLKTLDGGFAGLLDDLAAQGLAESTLVLCAGEFGRTPRINSKEGRDHHPRAFSAVLAGGGLKGGVVGATDREGDKVVLAPVTVADLFATVLKRMGLDPAHTFTVNERPIGRTDRGKPLALFLP